MSPVATLSSPPDIDFHADDAQMFMHLERMMRGTPPPSNVLTDFDPYTVKPENLPPQMFYLINSVDPKSLTGEKGIKTTEAGYWKTTVKYRTLERSHTMGIITILEFYRGQAPNGERTNWRMYQYTMDQNSLGFSSLCRVYLGEQSQSEEHQAYVDDDSGDLMKAILLSLSGAEENHRNLQDSANNSQVVSKNGHGPSTVLGSHLQNPRADISARGPYEASDFVSGEYLELNDLNSSGSSFSNSVDTCCPSITSDECFSKGDYLEINDLIDSTSSTIPDTEQQNVNCCPSITSDECFSKGDYLEINDLIDSTSSTIPDTEQQNVNCRFNVSATRGPNEVVVQLAPSGCLSNNRYSSINNSSSAHTMERVASSTATPICMGRMNPTLPAASIFETLPKQSTCKVNEVNCSAASSQGLVPSDAHGKKQAVGGRIAKLRKKYCCFLF